MKRLLTTRFFGVVSRNGIGADGAAGAFMAKITEIELIDPFHHRVEMSSTSIKATGVLTGEKRTIYAEGKGEAGKLKVEGSLQARFGPLGEWQVGSVDFIVFEGDEGKSEKTIIYSF
jgi:hypothetical protein